MLGSRLSYWSLGQTNYVLVASPPACFLDHRFMLFFINLRGRDAHFRAEITEKGVDQSRDYVKLLSFA